MDSALQDLRFALRSFSRSPGMTVALVVILALGIGGATAMFSVVYGVLLKPLPLHRPEQLVMFVGSVTWPPGEQDRLKFWSRGPSLESIAEVAGRGGVNLGFQSPPLYLPAAIVSANFLEVLREKPYLGRTFAPDEETAGGNRVVLLSYGLWQEVFAGDLQVLGKEVRLSGHPHTVIGVLRPGFTFPDETQVWIPRRIGARDSILGQFDQSELRYSIGVFGRLREESTFESARAEVQVLAGEMERLQGAAGLNAGTPASLAPLQRTIIRSHRGPIYVLFAAVGFLLLIACANAANLLLVRSATRQKEIAVRVALGAGRTRILRLLLAEGLLLAVVSGVAGTLLSGWLVNLIRLVGPASVPRLDEVRVDPVALAFALGVALLTGLLLTLAPAMQTSALKLTTALKEEGYRATGRLGKHARAALVIAEVALSVVLLTGAGLMLQTLHRLMSLDPGFNPTSVVTMHISLPTAKYGLATEGKSHELPPADKSRELDDRRIPVHLAHRQLLQVVDNVPGVLSVGSTHGLPLSDPVGMQWIDVPGVPQGTLATRSGVAGDYFRAMGVPLVAGRYFEERDFLRPDEPVIVSRSLAQRFWKNALGMKFWVNQKQDRLIVGVVEDTAMVELNDGAYLRPQFYVPSEKWNEFALVVRGMGRAEELSRAVRTAISSFDRELAVSRVQTMSEVVYKSVAPQRFRGQLLGAFAGTALVLALFGVAAVMAYSVTTRTHEMGVRMALGALRGDVLRMVLREGLRLALFGVLLGLLGAWWLSRYVASLLYGVSATDPWTYTWAAAALVAGGLLGSLAPALRASRVDPAVALRYE